MKFKPHFAPYDGITSPETGLWHEATSLKEIMDIEYPGGLVKARGCLEETNFKSEYTIWNQETQDWDIKEKAPHRF